MGKVLDFPSQQAQGLAYLERELRKLLRNKGADDQLIDYANEQLTAIYSRVSDTEKLPCSVQLPDGLSDSQTQHLREEIADCLGAMHRENHRLTLELIAQLLLTQVRLFQHERD